MLNVLSMSSTVSILDVARAAGVDKSTVSFVLNGKGDKLRISPATQERINATARQLGYHSPLRGISDGRSQSTAREDGGRIGLILSTASPATTLVLIPEEEKALVAAGYRLDIIVVSPDPAAASERVLRLLGEGPAGIICCPGVYADVSVIVSTSRPSCPVIRIWQDAAKAMLVAMAGGTLEQGAAPSGVEPVPVTPKPLVSPPVVAPPPVPAPVAIPVPVVPVVAEPPAAVPESEPVAVPESEPIAIPAPEEAPVVLPEPEVPVAPPVIVTEPVPVEEPPVVIVPLPDAEPLPVEPVLEVPEPVPVVVEPPVVVPETVPIEEPPPVVIVPVPESVPEPIVVEPAPVESSPVEPSQPELDPSPVSEPIPAPVPVFVEESGSGQLSATGEETEPADGNPLKGEG